MSRLCPGPWRPRLLRMMPAAATAYRGIEHDREPRLGISGFVLSMLNSEDLPGCGGFKAAVTPRFTAPGASRTAPVLTERYDPRNVHAPRP